MQGKPREKGVESRLRRKRMYELRLDRLASINQTEKGENSARWARRRQRHDTGPGCDLRAPLTCDPQTRT